MCRSVAEPEKTVLQIARFTDTPCVNDVPLNFISAICCLKVTVPWGTMLCSLVDGHKQLKVTCCLHVQSTKLLVYVNRIVPQISRLIFPFKFWLKV